MIVLEWEGLPGCIWGLSCKLVFLRVSLQWRAALHTGLICNAAFCPVGGSLEEELKKKIEKEWKEKLWARKAALDSEKDTMNASHEQDFQVAVPVGGREGQVSHGE